MSESITRECSKSYTLSQIIITDGRDELTAPPPPVIIERVEVAVTHFVDVAMGG
jgi:hypothetical protein